MLYEWEMTMLDRHACVSRVETFLLNERKYDIVAFIDRPMEFVKGKQEFFQFISICFLIEETLRKLSFRKQNENKYCHLHRWFD